MADGFVARGVVTAVAQKVKAAVNRSAKKAGAASRASHCLGGVLRFASRDDSAALALG